MAATVVVTAAAGAALLAGCGSDDDGGDADEFCAGVASNVAGIVAPPLVTEDDIDATLGLYRELADLAPIAIEEEWRDLLFNVETASTVAPDDPESVQRTVAVAYATEKSAVAVRSWVLTNCGVDLGPVTTLVPQGPAPTTTLPPDVSTSIATVGETTTTAAATPATTPVAPGEPTTPTTATTIAGG
ncbi:MAG: hypothetical protein ACRDZZ_03465 [Ilumatobacteraceae bacterium]